MMKECDFVSEARNIGEFSSYLDRNGLRTIATAPFVFSQLSSKRCVSIGYCVHPLQTCCSPWCCQLLIAASLLDLCTLQMVSSTLIFLFIWVNPSLQAGAA